MLFEFVSSGPTWRMLLRITASTLVIVILLYTSDLQPVEADSSFFMRGDQYSCDHNILCLGDAHIYQGVENRLFPGVLSLAHKDVIETDINSGGIAYYPTPIKLLDRATQTAASFNTSFQFYEIPFIFQQPQANCGDGMTFLISADNSTLGGGGSTFGVFRNDGSSDFKTVVVEFDSFLSTWSPANDISNNHVSIDIGNISAAVSRNASDVGIQFWREQVIYAWVEYLAQTELLEVRISKLSVRPTDAFIKYKVNLFDAVNELMWVGFSAGNGWNASAYYVGNWSFQSFGIPEIPRHVARPTKERRTSVAAFAAVLGISAIVIALMGISVVVLCYLRRASLKKGGGYFKFTNLEDEYGEPYRFSLEDLREATKGFSIENKLGEGGFGCVFRGELPASKAPVAVKRISSESQQGEKEFRAEVSVISQLRHRNLIRLLGCCIGDGKYYIVYDLMTNGSLEKYLSPKANGEGGVSLTWPQRHKILLGVATAVEYLHNGWNQKVIHRDIKASNVMIDDQWDAKLGDFGLARVAEHQGTPHTMTVAGTPGYMAPEIIASRTYTEKTDVFAFGTLALEMACGRRSLALYASPEEMILVDWVWERLSEGNLFSVVDKRLDQVDVKQMENLLLLGLICAHPDPATRPPMRVVVQVLNGDAPVPAVPTEKPSTGHRISIDEWTGQSEAPSLFRKVNTEVTEGRTKTRPGGVADVLLFQNGVSISDGFP